MITVTENAAKRLKELMTQKKEDGTELNQNTVGLRVFVQGGGCSGFQYGMLVDDEPKNNDLQLESNGIRIFVDPISVNYLKGVEIDFDDFKGGFFVKNPNAKSTCGCGQSFTTE